MERKSKTTFRLETPFTRALFPEVSQEHQNIILEHLCSALSPIGQYRINHVTASKGKRSKKRKRQNSKNKEEHSGTVRPPPPGISSSVVVGLSSITRNLEELSRRSKSVTSIQKSPNEAKSAEDDKVKDLACEMESKICASHFSAIFILSQSLPPALRDHLPQLVATASLAHPTLPATRLVQLPEGCEAQVSSALGLQRASVVGILNGAQNVQQLTDLIREHVPPVRIWWLDEVKQHRYLPVKIKPIETFGWVAEKES